MRQFVLSIIVTTALSGGTSASACGDKLLAVGRGVRFQRFYAAHRANLLIYSGTTRPGAALHSARLQTALKRVVHDLQIVSDRSQLERALSSGQVDVVLVDLPDLGDIAGQLQSAASRPVVLPVLGKPSKVDLAAAEKKYKFAVKAEADELGFLTAIDDAMKSKLRVNAKS